MKLSIWITVLTLGMAGAIGLAAVYEPGPKTFNALPPVVARLAGNAALDRMCVAKDEGFLKGYGHTWSAAYLASFKGKPVGLKDIFFDDVLARCAVNRKRLNATWRKPLDAAAFRYGDDSEVARYLKAEPVSGKAACAEARRQARDISKACAPAFPSKKAVAEP